MAASSKSEMPQIVRATSRIPNFLNCIRNPPISLPRLVLACGERELRIRLTFYEISRKKRRNGGFQVDVSITFALTCGPAIGSGSQFVSWIVIAPAMVLKFVIVRD